MCWAVAVAVMLWLAVDVPSAAAVASESCSAVKSVYQAQGFRETVPSQPISGRYQRPTSPVAESRSPIRRVCMNISYSLPQSLLPSHRSQAPRRRALPSVWVILPCIVCSIARFLVHVSAVTGRLTASCRSPGPRCLACRRHSSHRRHLVYNVALSGGAGCPGVAV